MKSEDWQSLFRRGSGVLAPIRRGPFWLVLAAGAMLGLLIQRFLVCFVVVHGQSMAPNFSEGQVCLVNKAMGELHRGDVVIIRDGEYECIKRVVGLPNESLLFRLGRVYVNGRELSEPYLDQAVSTFPFHQTRFTLGPEQVFVMGDNRRVSEDSRMYGPVRWGAVLGKVAP
jgi:signal peptidase I